jgi:dephospho-CoA kinase
MKQILLIGHAQHGKDTTAEIMKELYGFRYESSSVAASRIFLFDVLKKKYGYLTPEQCYEDRVNHRDEWYDLICEYNSVDRARLAKEIMRNGDMYVGMRDDEEIQECRRQGVFDLVIGVFDPRKPLEPATSFNIDIWEMSDFIIPNSGTLYDLRTRIELLEPLLINKQVSVPL